MRPMLFPFCRHGRHSRWAVLVEGRPYGEYLDREAAVLDAIEAVKDARGNGHEAEALDRSSGLRLSKLYPVTLPSDAPMIRWIVIHWFELGALGLLALNLHLVHLCRLKDASRRPGSADRFHALGGRKPRQGGWRCGTGVSTSARPRDRSRRDRFQHAVLVKRGEFSI